MIPHTLMYFITIIIHFDVTVQYYTEKKNRVLVLLSVIRGSKKSQILCKFWYSFRCIWQCRCCFCTTGRSEEPQNQLRVWVTLCSELLNLLQATTTAPEPLALPTGFLKAKRWKWARNTVKGLIRSPLDWNWNWRTACSNYFKRLLFLLSSSHCIPVNWRRTGDSECGHREWFN